MRSKVVKLLALALVLGGVGIALAQSPPAQPQPQPPRKGAPSGQKSKAPAEKSKLEGMLAEALRNNPDIRVAAANLTLAEAELNRTRLEVTQKVLTLYHAIQSQQATVDFEQKQYDRFRELLERRAIEEKLVEERNTKLMAAKAKLAELEAQMPALLGKTAHGKAEDVAEGAVLLGIEWLARQKDSEVVRLEAIQALVNVHKVTGPMADKIRKSLETSITVDYKDVSFQAILKDLEKKVPGLKFNNHYTSLNNERITLSFDNPLPVAAVLEAIEDHFLAAGRIKDEALCFVIRQYGILIAAQAYAPPKALTIQEFLRQKPAEK